MATEARKKVSVEKEGGTERTRERERDRER